MNQKRNKTVGYLLALLLGGVGAHLFYYGKYVRGGLYLIFSWTYVPIVLGWIDLCFINKWHEDFEVNNTRKSIGDEVNKFSSEIDDLMMGNKEKFYNEKTIILSKYAHIKTPQNFFQGSQKKDIRDIGYGMTIEVSISTGSKDFIKDSLKYANNPGKPAQFIPLMAYYTTFKDLNKEQKNWYFYWRRNVLDGVYLDTSLSYIFLFTYELLNYSFNQNAAFNISMLDRLYKSYVDRYDRLTGYLPIWISDFLIELEEEELAKEWWIPQDYATDKLYRVLKERTQPLEKISISLWKPYIVNYRETAFFQKNKNKIYTIFKESIPLLEQEYLAKGKSLLNQWFRVGQKNETRRLFSGAVINRRAKQKVFTVEYVTPKPSINTTITNLFRMAENVTRLVVGEKRQLKVNEDALPIGLKQKMLDKFQKATDTVNPRFIKVQSKVDQNMGSLIPNKSEEIEVAHKQKIALDLERVATLKEESKSLQDEFEQRFGDLEEETVNLKEEIKSANNTSEENHEIALTPNWSEILEIDEDFDEFSKSLNQNEKEFLSGFYNLRRNVQEGNNFLKTKGFMAAVFINDLNEKANGFLGDNLIEIDGDEYEIYEEYESILNQLKEGA